MNAADSATRINAAVVREGSPSTIISSRSSSAVGLSAVMAARIVGATTIVAADVVPSRLEMAKELEATHVVDSKQQDPVQAITKLTGGGANYSLEATGRPEVLRQAIDAVGIGGVCGIVGAAPLGVEERSTSTT